MNQSIVWAAVIGIIVGAFGTFDAASKVKIVRTIIWFIFTIACALLLAVFTE